MPLIRVSDPADPRRCKGASKDGQCQNIAEEGYAYCLVHGGRVADDKHLQREYLLAQVKDRFQLASVAGAEQLKSLRDEIALVRELVARMWDRIETDQELIQSCGMLNTLCLTLERLKKSNIQFERSGGALLDKDAILQLGHEICTIIVQELSDVENYEQIVDRVSDQISTVILEAQNIES